MNEAEVSAPVLNLRNDLRSHLKILRNEKRHNKIDGVRIGIGELNDYLINLESFGEKDVLNLAQRIKQQKHAKPNDLNRLCNAFLQTTENIKCFLNVTGALNVVVKELTGNDTTTQILAIECVCNMSLGSEISCEKITLNAGSYLITFLKSSNERLMRTSLWCLTNLIASGNKSLQILINQELIKSLININTHCLNEDIRNEAYATIELAIGLNGNYILRSVDTTSLLEWIVSHKAPYEFALTKVTYKLLNQLNFQLNEESHLIEIMKCIVETLNHLYEQLLKNENVNDSALELTMHLLLVLRIMGNVIALEDWAANLLIENGFASKNLSMSTFFNTLIDLTGQDMSYRNELLWIIGNLTASKHLNSSTLEYLKCDNFVNQLKIDTV